MLSISTTTSSATLLSDYPSFGHHCGFVFVLSINDQNLGVPEHVAGLLQDPQDLAWHRSSGSVAPGVVSLQKESTIPL